jgi:hypothetical protein
VDLNPYVMETLTRYRLEELRAGAELRGRLRAGAAAPRPLRVSLGLALIRVGTWVVGDGRRALRPRVG